jgi:ribosome-associated translation inhibitor RaiA
VNLRVTIKGIEDKSALRDQAQARAAAALSRFRNRIRNARVLLEDVTGPHKQVVDKRCRIDVLLKHGVELTIDEVRTDILASLAVALDRLKAVIGREVGKAKRGIGAG